MELKQLVQQFAYRIEPKPEGGFIARCSDPTVPPLEAPTREELQQQIQARLRAALQEKFPGLNLPPLENKQVKWEVHIDRKPGGGFTVHSDQQESAGLNPETQQKIDHFAEELLGFVDKHFPDMSQAIAAQVGGRDLQVFTSETARVTMNKGAALGAQDLLPARLLQDGAEKSQDVSLEATNTGSAAINSAAITNAPITPEASGAGKVFRFLLAFLVLAVLIYFFLHRG
jgi:hypothetical protein